MPFADRASSLGSRLVRTAGSFLGEGKLARGVRGRNAALDRLEAWGAEARDPGRPLFWFHAPSVGEALQARAVIRALREQRPEVQVAFTWFSPSAEGWIEEMDADIATYLPWDVPADCRRALHALRPSLLAFTKTEVWPVLSREAVRQAVPLVLVAATLPHGSSRLAWPGRAFLRAAFSRLAIVAAIQEEDAERFEMLGVPAGRRIVTGDPGVDSAARRVRGADPTATHLRPFAGSGAPILVAGSTWPEDEAVLVPALAEVRARGGTGLRAIVAPHEPSGEHLAGLEARLGEAGLESVRLSELEGDATPGPAGERTPAGESSPALSGTKSDRDGRAAAPAASTVPAVPVVVVDRVGILASLYTVGDLAWVGGGFGTDGLHSVLEPASAGLPILFGPAHESSYAAGALVQRGAARVVHDPQEAQRILEVWVMDEGERRKAGAAASSWIDQHLGAADRTAALLATRT